MATQANVLKQLIGARGYIMSAKVQVIEELVEKVTKSNSAFKNDLREARVHRDELLSAFAGDASEVTGDAKIFKEQVD